MIAKHLRLHCYGFLMLALTCVPSMASDLAPEFTVPTQLDSISLQQLKGKVVYLDFWASWCKPCFTSFPWMEKMQQKYKDKGLVVLAINLDKDRNLSNKFLEKQTTSFTIGFDSVGSVPTAYKLQGMPSAFIIDKTGVIRFRHVGFNEEKAEIYEKQLASLLVEN